MNMLAAGKVLLLGAALILGGALSASAADLGGDLNDAPAMAPMPAPSAGWYLRADGGYNWFASPSVVISRLCISSFPSRL